MEIINDALRSEAGIWIYTQNREQSYPIYSSKLFASGLGME